MLAGAPETPELPYDRPRTNLDFSLEYYPSLSDWGRQRLQLDSAVKREIWPLVESGQVKPVVFQVFPFRQAADAHRLMESSTHVGKIVLRME